ncbi:MAG: TetR/AcrR family transcriptional regulator [Steroidobacteraceae bacterium]
MKKKSPAVTRRKAAPSATVRKRKRGRPLAVHPKVGREAIVAAARQLVDRLRPHQVSIALIAREAGVDPALVRYYFTNREHVMLAVVESILADWAAHPSPDEAPVAQIEMHLSNMLRFSRSVRSMQRLMVEECAEAKSPAVRARVQELNNQALQQLSGLFRVEGKGETRSPDALFMHIAMIGLCEFFATVQALILPLAPKGTSPTELAASYEEFIHDLVLDGIRKRLKPADSRH